MTKERDEARQRFDEFLKDEKFTKGKELPNDSPDFEDDATPHENWKQDKDGNWYLPGWKLDDDIWVPE